MRICGIFYEHFHILLEIRVHTVLLCRLSMYF
nr:MAG TPA: hypothetical protein [Bacteriophage sp.]